MTQSIVCPLHLDKVQNWAYVDGLFTPEECAKIIEVGNAQLQPALITDKGVEIKALRDSKIAWLYPAAGDIEFIFGRVITTINHINSEFFKFDLFGLMEGFQFTRYDAPTGCYGLHTDKVLDGPVRKLSLTIQLSSPQDYEGGELALQLGSEALIMPKEQGKMVVFPSYTLHEVRPVTKGTRYSLVAWVTGMPFK
jgi:PKHD-type hydroxylase